ncbi:MAG TPA: flavodoxin family protein, partial [bacterium (Candidatus Stahlbacteria)]|nr:flavodoxin family protein [Candidatus Stahlbacteria bacterium]
MKVLGIVGSPRKGGNTDTLVREVLKGANSKGAETEKVYLGDLNIRPCDACGLCSENGKCVVKDDFQLIFQKIKESDGVVLGSPIYCSTVTAQTKALIDRIDFSQVIMKTTSSKRKLFLSRLKGGKKGVIVCVGDQSSVQDFKHTVWVMTLFFKDLNIEVVDKVIGSRLS